VARRYELTHRTVALWRDAAVAEGIWPALPGEKSSQEPPMDSRSLEELVGAYVVSTLDAIRVQAGLLGDRAWLEQQSALDILQIHRQVVDRAARLRAPVPHPPAAAGTLPDPGAGDPSADPARLSAPGLDGDPAGD